MNNKRSISTAGLGNVLGQFTNLCFGSKSNLSVNNKFIFCTSQQPINSPFLRLLTFSSQFAANCKVFGLFRSPEKQVTMTMKTKQYTIVRTFPLFGREDIAEGRNEAVL